MELKFNTSIKLNLEVVNFIIHTYNSDRSYSIGTVWHNYKNKQICLILNSRIWELNETLCYADSFESAVHNEFKSQ